MKKSSLKILTSALGLTLGLALGLWSCTKTTSPVPTAEPPAEVQKANLVEKGQKVYSQNCIACHNPNPKLDGAIGPNIYGSSLELISARVLKASYPTGYKPKRTTTQMPALAGLEKEIPALYAFLNH